MLPVIYISNPEKEVPITGAKLKIATTLLGDRRVGMIVENSGFDSDATIHGAIDLGYVVGKKEVIKAF